MGSVRSKKDGNALKDFQVLPHMCYEVCGDAWNFGKFQCDDGNVDYLALGADGVNKTFHVTTFYSCLVTTCQISAGFECRYGNKKTRDSCHEICGDGYHYGNAFWNYDRANECDDGS